MVEPPRPPAATVSAAPGSVLFICNRNTIRSPMAELLLKQQAGRRVFVDSVGMLPGEPDGFVQCVMAEIGLDLSAHRPKGLDEVDVSSFDLILSLAEEAHRSVLERTRTAACVVEYWPAADPALVEGSRETRLLAYRALRDDLRQRLAHRFPPP